MKHFTMAELTRSETAKKLGLDNTPPTEHIQNIETTVKQLLDPIREAWAIHCAGNQFGTPALRVSSGYRGEAVNKAVGGSKTSAHGVGYAFDLVPDNGRLLEFKRFCRDWLADRAFDQMISEDENVAGVPRWIHLGYKNRTGGQRRQLLTMRGGKYTTMTR